MEDFLEYLKTANLEEECKKMSQFITNQAAGEQKFRHAIWSTIEWKKSDPLPRMLLGVMICFVALLCFVALFK